jgi:uncharacterized protein (TIGR02246 family)
MPIPFSASLSMKRLLQVLIAGLAVMMLVPSLHAQADAVKQVLADQENAWNRGDIAAFMTGYADSPQTTFIGTTIEHGYRSIFARYQKKYASREAMGHLDFTNLTVRMLGADHAVVTGHFHLTRSATGGGDASGIFSLLFEKEAAGWKIILDHTSAS